MPPRFLPLHRAALCAGIYVVLATTPASATERIGVGAAAAPTPALSVQLARGAAAPASSWHLLAQYKPGVAGASVDHQWRHTPSFGWGRGWRLDLYSGLGLQGLSDREADTRENYHLRLPLGVQWNLESMHLSAFVEGAGLLGPMPRTRTAATAAAGLRATF
jgi:hypothetical protein